MIDRKFIKKWSPSYDGEADDETEYLDLVKCLGREARSECIPFDTIQRAVEWKTPRIKGKMNYAQQEKYCAFVQLAYQVPDRKAKLWLLTSLEGWGIPMASTVLHLLHPNRFPIIDFRVLEVLRDKDGFHANRDSEKGYWNYYERIQEIKQHSGCPLREIDRALWAYHAIHYATSPNGAQKCLKQTRPRKRA